MRPTFDAADIENLDRFEAMVKMQAGGETLAAFSMRTALPIEEPPDADEREERIRQISRRKYARPQQEVEEEINAYYHSSFLSTGRGDGEDYREEL